MKDLNSSLAIENTESLDTLEGFFRSHLEAQNEIMAQQPSEALLSLLTASAAVAMKFQVASLSVTEHLNRNLENPDQLEDLVLFHFSYSCQRVTESPPRTSWEFFWKARIAALSENKAGKNYSSAVKAEIEALRSL